MKHEDIAKNGHMSIKVEPIIRHFQLKSDTDSESDNGLSINSFEGSYKI